MLSCFWRQVHQVSVPCGARGAHLASVCSIVAHPYALAGRVRHQSKGTRGLRRF